ncbi:hypothetical protein GCM10023322_70980 [Rugosimonospora acidiphila]|uniref:Uncharacterized protein n=1 Tax=Rugosimonospora acidiphila TaxID=556531 RepID=A0ABP9SKN3_9ACTN
MAAIPRWGAGARPFPSRYNPAKEAVALECSIIRTNGERFPRTTEVDPGVQPSDLNRSAISDL